MSEEQGQVRKEELDQPARARRRLALAQIRQYGDPALRLTAREVETFDEDLERLVERMFALMHDASGVGLAATQVGVLQRVFVVEPADEEPQALVNPHIVEPQRTRRRSKTRAASRCRACSSRSSGT